MTQEEIIRGNGILAQFDGWKLRSENYVNSNNERFPWWEKFVDGVCVMNRHHDILNGKGRFEWGSYNNSWGWIMPVVAKINKLPEGYHFIIYGAVAEVVETNAPFETVTKTSVTDKEPEIIEAVWKTAVNFIEWYNQQSKL